MRYTLRNQQEQDEQREEDQRNRAEQELYRRLNKLREAAIRSNRITAKDLSVTVNPVEPNYNPNKK